MLKLLKQVVFGLLAFAFLSFGVQVKFEWKLVDFCGCIYYMSGECQNFDAYKALYSAVVHFTNFPMCFDWFPFEAKLQAKVPMCSFNLVFGECTGEEPGVKPIKVEQSNSSKKSGVLLWLEY